MITVVISSFHYGHLAAHCIESLLSQTKKPDQILFVDDGADDCSHLPKIYQEVEYVMRRENFGIVRNFDDMLQRVNSEFVMFVGADNWFRSDTIEVLEKIQSTENFDVLTYDIIVTGELKKEINNRHPGEIKKQNGDFYWTRKGHHGSMLYRTSLGKKIGYKKRVADAKYTEEDWSLWIEMTKMNARIGYVPQALLFYRRHRENFLKY